MLTIPKPIDCHLHLRENELLTRTVPDAVAHFSQAIIMPNLTSPIQTAEEMIAYQNAIIQHIPKGQSFTPLMTLYLTATTTPKDIEQAKAVGLIAVKLYPKGATTNSQQGVSSLSQLNQVLSCLEALAIPLCIHGEVTDPSTDIFDRESLFIEEMLRPICHKYPKLKIVLEHISTEEAVKFVQTSSHPLAATITPHHMYLNRNNLLTNGIKPHFYCLPILKRATDQQALIKAATSGDPRFFLGTDSAPHAIGQKESACGCAGIYSSPTALSIYTQLFEERDALDKLSNFSSHFGAKFYELQPTNEQLTLIKKPWTIPPTLNFGNHLVTPLGARETLSWQIKSSITPN